MKSIPNNGCHTLEEIKQQPKLWEKIYYLMKNNKEEISTFLNDLLDKELTRVILVGSGASAYVGDTLSPYLSEMLKVPVDSIPAAEIINNPYSYLRNSSNVLVILYSRSGNTQEIIDASKTFNNLLKDSSYIIVTSNNQSQLINNYADKKNSFTLLLPKESNDKGFAMTSSFSCMILSTILLFNINNIEKEKTYLDQSIMNSKHILSTIWSDILNMVRRNPSRILYVGSSELKGMSDHCALNTLKLTNGKIYSLSWSPSNINQSIKPFITNDTIIFLFKSNNNSNLDYNEKFLDIIKNESASPFVVVISENSSYLELCNKCFYINYKDSSLPNIYLVLNYVIYAQIFSYMYSLHLGLSPDIPTA